jgi:hypothetical protein
VIRVGIGRRSESAIWQFVKRYLYNEYLFLCLSSYGSKLGRITKEKERTQFIKNWSRRRSRNIVV